MRYINFLMRKFENISPKVECAMWNRWFREHCSNIFLVQFQTFLQRLKIIIHVVIPLFSFQRCSKISNHWRGWHHAFHYFCKNAWNNKLDNTKILVGIPYSPSCEPPIHTYPSNKSQGGIFNKGVVTRTLLSWLATVIQ